MESKKILKVALIGNTGVGKSAISSRYTRNIFEAYHQQTIGMDLNIKIESILGIQLRYEIFELTASTAYMQSYGKILEKMNIIIIVFDKDLRHTFKDVKFWINFINLHNSESIPRVKFLVGNNNDSGFEVSFEEGLKKAKKYNLIYVETSAKENKGIKELFEMAFVSWVDYSNLGID